MNKVARSSSSLLLIHATLLQLSSFVVRPAATYRALELNVSTAYIGLIAASFAVLPLFATFMIGRESDRGNNSRVLLNGSILMLVVGFGLILFSNSIEMIVFWVLLMGLGHMMSVVGQQAMIANARSSDLDKAFGMYTFAGSLGQAIGPALILLSSGSSVIPDTWRLFLFYLIAVVLLLVTTLFLIQTPEVKIKVSVIVEEVKIKNLWSKVDVKFKPSLSVGMLVSLISIGSIDVLAIYLPAIGIDRGIPSATIGILLSARAIATMISRFHLARLSDYFGRNRLIIISTALAGALMVAIAFPAPVLLLGFIIVLIGFTIGISQPLTMTIITLSAPLDSRGIWLSLRLAANRIGQAALPAAVGFTTVPLGTGAAFGSTGLLLIGVASISQKLLPASTDQTKDRSK